jgi:hypothetical protein
MMKNNFLSLERVAKAGIKHEGARRRTKRLLESLAMPICERTLWALDLCQCQNNIDDRLNIYRQEGKEERYDFGRGSNRLVVFLILFIHGL